ncbi:MAG: LacI family transcriptional regulator [Desulfuromonadales bacterium]|nr:LacI family transcriptional regulator [Desulfuromonadales bacterium]
MTKGPRPPTISDVAAQAGVSKRTVSRVLNDSPLVNDTTRATVQKVIRELNYTPNRHARSLRAKRSYLIGLVYDVPTLFINDIQKGILNICSDAGYELVVHACHIDHDDLVEDVLKFVDRAKPDGVIMVPPVSLLDTLAEALDGIGCRYIRFTSDVADEPWKLVVTNYTPAISDMTNHLVQLGHRRMAFISGPKTNPSSKKRQEAFEQALAQHRLALSPDMVEVGAFTYESGFAAAKKLLSNENRPTAIFAGNDEMAFAVMHVADEMGLDIPDDLSLVGFDGTPFSTIVIPALSTILRPSTGMSQLATRKLLALINNGPDGARDFDTMVSPQYVPRESTGPAPST